MSAPPPYPPYPEPVPATTVTYTPPRSSPLLAVGSILRIVGVILAGFAVIWLGVWIMNPAGMIDPSNPFGAFQTLGAIVVLSGVGSILLGIGWAVQTWGVGKILIVDRK